MHPNRTASVLLVVFGGLLLLGIWIWRSERADARHGNPGAASVPDDPDDGTEDVADAGSHGQPVESPFGRTETEGLMPNVLELRILREDGGHAKGKVYWTTTPRAPLTSSMMAPEHGFPLPEEGVHSLSHAGAASLSIPDGMWTWLRVTAEGSAVLSAYELVPPFSGEREMDLLLTAASRTLHVFLVESDLDTPAADREVSLYTTDMRSVSSPELRARTRSDESGYAVFRGLSPGGFLLCAEGAKPGDPLPYTQRLIMPAKMPITELPCTLVVPEERIEITIQVDVTLGRTGGLPPKLFLKRKEKRVGDLHPMSGYLRPGQ